MFETGFRRKCDCEWCTRINPALRRLRVLLKNYPDLWKVIEDIEDRMSTAEMDVAVCEAKMAGEWSPDWDGMKEVIQKKLDENRMGKKYIQSLDDNEPTNYDYDPLSTDH